jgi:hypothetical protein
MKPWSCGSTAWLPPAATAFFTISSTSARLWHDSATSVSVWVRASQRRFFVKVWKKG